MLQGVSPEGEHGRKYFHVGKPLSETKCSAYGYHLLQVCVRVRVRVCACVCARVCVCTATTCGLGLQPLVHAVAASPSPSPSPPPRPHSRPHPHSHPHPPTPTFTLTRPWQALRPAPPTPTPTLGQALRALAPLGSWTAMHAHCGNCFVTPSQSLVLGEWEGVALGLPSSLETFVVALAGVLEPAVAALAHALYEMATGYESDAPRPSVFPPSCSRALLEALQAYTTRIPRTQPHRPPPHPRTHEQSHIAAGAIRHR